jgi:hypothetical protein
VLYFLFAFPQGWILIDGARPQDRALRAAVCFDAEDVLELLYEPVLGLRADMAEKQRLRGQLFHMAVEYDAQNATRALLKRGVSVDTKNDRGETPLHAVCRSFECETMLELLLTHRADGNLVVPATGYSPYHLAVQHHGLHTIEILARHGAAINLFDRVRGLALPKTRSQLSGRIHRTVCLFRMDTRHSCLRS